MHCNAACCNFWICDKYVLQINSLNKINMEFSSGRSSAGIRPHTEPNLPPAMIGGCNLWFHRDYFTAHNPEFPNFVIINLKHLWYVVIPHRAGSDRSPAIAEEKEQTGKHQYTFTVLFAACTCPQPGVHPTFSIFLFLLKFLQLFLSSCTLLVILHFFQLFFSFGNLICFNWTFWRLIVWGCDAGQLNTASTLWQLTDCSFGIFGNKIKCLTPLCWENHKR